MPPLLFVGAEGQETKDEDSPSYHNKYEASKVVDKVNYHMLIYMFYCCAYMSVYRFFSL